MEIAAHQGLATIAFPAISTGVYCFPIDGAADIAVTTICGCLERYPSIRQVVFACFDQVSLAAHQAAIARIRL
jgi:O-acetyl-ADP-ribose deacetylase (regulator of RNase III)